MRRLDETCCNQEQPELSLREQFARLRRLPDRHDCLRPRHTLYLLRQCLSGDDRGAAAYRYEPHAGAAAILRDDDAADESSRRRR